MYALSQHPIYDAVSPIARIYGPWNQEVEMGEVPLTIIPINPKFSLLVPKELVHFQLYTRKLDHFR